MRPVSVTVPMTAKSSSHLWKIAAANSSRPGFSTISMRSCDSDSIIRSEEHTSELQSLMRISYAVFCLKKKKSTTTSQPPHTIRHSTTHTHSLHIIAQQE